MGYQVVEATLSDNKTKRGVAYNAELLLFEEEPRRIMLSTPYLRLLESARSATGEIKSLRVISRATVTDIQRGIVEPAFGQPGGGVEVIFTNGTQPKTVTRPMKIP